MFPNFCRREFKSGLAEQFWIRVIHKMAFTNQLKLQSTQGFLELAYQSG